MNLSVEQKQLMDQEVAPMVAAAQALIVRTDQQSLDAQQILKDIKSRRNRIAEFFAPMKAKAHAAWKEICNSESDVDKPLAAAESTIKNKVIAYNNEVEYKRREEARLAEAKRLEAERKERERLEAQAKKAEEAGKVEKAEALREKAETVVVQPTFTPQAPAPKLEGSSIRKTWKGEVVDIVAVCKAISEGRLPASVVAPVPARLNDYAKLQKTAGVFNGIAIKEVSEMAVRG